MKFTLSIVIPNFNGRKLLEENIPHLKTALDLSGAQYEIIVSDDASTDDSVSFLRKNYPEIQVITSLTNRGFSPNANNGIAACKMDLVFLMNTDIQITGDYFSRQFLYFEDQTTFGVMGRIVGSTDNKTQDTAKYPLFTLSGLRTTKNYTVVPEDLNSPGLPTLFLSGANALIDRKKLMLLNGFDETFAPFYGEDVELCIRAWRLGWKCWYEPRSVCKHPVSATINRTNNKSQVRITALANKITMHAIHLGFIGKIWWLLFNLFRTLFSWLALDFDYYKILALYLKKSKNIHDSRKKFIAAADKAGVRKLLSLGQVIWEIKHILKGKHVVLK